jgi:acetylornithine deacetylase/succinyl-diaminopimelate desuccinylase family protein
MRRTQTLPHNSLKIDPKLTFKLLRDLIKIPSVNPSIHEDYDEEAIANYIARWLRKTKRFSVIEQTVDKNRFNVIAILDGKGDGKSLMLNGHMDTVGTSYMTANPFRAVIRNGRVYGRGACDMKGSLAAMMSAILALANFTKRLEGDVIFSGVVDEEHGSKGTAKLIERFRPDAAIVGEPTDLDIAIAHKGYAWVEVEIFGKEAHGSVPERGVDAIEKMATLVTRLETLRRQHKLLKHPLVGIPKIHTSTISGGTDWSTVPGKCVLRLERRLIPGEKPEDSIKEVRKLIHAISMKDDEFRAKVKLIHHADSMEIDARAPHIRILQEAAKRFTGKGRIVGVPYWTDASLLLNRGKISSCLFGPGDIGVAHSKNENIKVRDVEVAARIYAATAWKYSNVK